VVRDFQLVAGGVIAGIGLITVLHDFWDDKVDFKTEVGMLDFIASSIWLIGGLVIIFS